MGLLTRKKKAVPKEIGTKSTTISNTGSQKEEGTVKPAPTRPKFGTKRKTVIPPIKEVKTHVEETSQPKVEQRKEGESQTSSKPMPTSGRQDTPTRPTPASARPQEGKVSTETMRAMSLTERYVLWKKLNKNNEIFAPIRKELPKNIQMRLLEAVERGIVEKKPPRDVPKSVMVYYCPYCVDWQVYHHHGWTGYNKCTGCSISTKDYHVSADNGLFGKD